MLVPPNNSFQRRREKSSEADSSTSYEATIAANPLDLSNGNLLADLSSTAPDGSVGWSPSSQGWAVAYKASASLAEVPPPASSNVQMAPAITIADGASAEIAGVSAQAVTFTGTTGTLKLDDALAFTGQVAGLTGSDAIDLADVSYGIQTQVTYLGNTTGGTLTITDGVHTANIALQGNYLSSYWTLSNDGNGGTTVVDPVSSNTWQDFAVGAGGFLTGMSIANDGTMVVRTDVFGAYIWNGNEWQQLITASSMPANFVASSEFTAAQGVYSLQIAPGNSQILYMVYTTTTPGLSGVYKSTNQGQTWTLTSFTPLSHLNPNGSYRQSGPTMAIDPTNPNIVYVGTAANGLFVTTDGGNTWSTVSGVPTGLSDGSGNYPGITGVLFDPGNTNIIFAASYGNGVFETTNGGTSWSKLSGGPSNVWQAAISSNGTYYATDLNSDLWVEANGTWTEAISSGTVAGVTVNPANPNEVVVTNQNGQLNESLNNGATWSGWSGVPTTNTSQIPWLAMPWGPGPSGLAFNPANPNQLFINGNQTVSTTTLSGNVTSSTIPNWTDQGVGLEELVANQILVAPVAGSIPLLASWDTAVIRTNGTNYATTSNIYPDNALASGWSIDYASSDPNFIVLLADGSFAGGPQESSYSTNDGQTWTLLPTQPYSTSGGNIAASTPTNFIFDGAGQQPYYTLDGGNTWHPVVLPGVSNYSLFQPFNNAHVIAADRVEANTFYIFDNGTGVFKTTNGGVTWTLVNSSINNIVPSYDYTSPNLQATPGVAGDLWLTNGLTGGGAGGSLLHSTDGGSTWTAVANVVMPIALGFGAPAPGQSYPALYMAGIVNGVYGIWQSINDAQSWTQLGPFPNGSLDTVKTISGDPNVYGKVYVGFGGSGYAYLQPSRQ